MVPSGLPHSGEVLNSVPWHRFPWTEASAPPETGSPQASPYDGGGAAVDLLRTAADVPATEGTERNAVTPTAATATGPPPTAGQMHSTRPQYGQTGTMVVMPCTMPS